MLSAFFCRIGLHIMYVSASMSLLSIFILVHHVTSESTASTTTTSTGTGTGIAMAQVNTSTIDSDCMDRQPSLDCDNRARAGQCLLHPGWMVFNCAKSCGFCALRDPTVRCDLQRLNLTSVPVYQPGSIDDVFSKLVEKYHHRYEVNVLSTSPWVVTFDNFLTDIEINAMISNIGEHEWDRSKDTGEPNAFGEYERLVSKNRTSRNAWCYHQCESDPAVKSVARKIAEITQIPQSNWEQFQLLRYEVGEYYLPHHDMGSQPTGLICGPRILTFFMYLSDVEEGGETGFPMLNIDVKPIKGRALLWPSVMNEDLFAKDDRTTHEAKPVIRGQKFAANTWLRLFDFRVPNKWGCTG